MKLFHWLSASLIFCIAVSTNAQTLSNQHYTINNYFDTLYAGWFHNTYMVENRSIYDSAKAKGVNAGTFANQLTYKCTETAIKLLWDSVKIIHPEIFNRYPIFSNTNDTARVPEEALRDSTVMSLWVDSTLSAISKESDGIDDDFFKLHYRIEKCTDLLETLSTSNCKYNMTQGYDVGKALYKSLNTLHEKFGELFITKVFSADYMPLLAQQIQNQENPALLDSIYDTAIAISSELSKRYPEIYAIRCASLSSRNLELRILSGDNENAIVAAFQKYRESFPVVNSVLPDCYIDSYLDFNASLEAYLTAYHSFVLNEEIPEFSKELLGLKSKAVGEDTDITTAFYNNLIGQKLFNEEVYDESLAYLHKSNNLFKKCKDKNPKNWLDFLASTIQIGDSHLKLNQFDKAIMTYSEILDYEKQVPSEYRSDYIMIRGVVHQSIGNAYKLQNELKSYQKEYVLAEKDHKEALSMGNKKANFYLGELYYNKAVEAAQKNDDQKCMALIDKTVNYFEAYGLESPNSSYENAKNAQLNFSKEANNYLKTVECTEELIEYYKRNIPYNSRYAAGVYDLAKTIVNDENIARKTRLERAKDMTDALVVLDDNGFDIDSYVLGSLAILGEMYALNDSAFKAIEIYRDCLRVNDEIYKDTANMRWRYINVDIYHELSENYTKLASRLDTSNAEKWYMKSIETSDTLIGILTDLGNEGDENSVFKAAIEYQHNALNYDRLNNLEAAIENLDKSNNILMKFYNSEYKKDVEITIVNNNYYKGVFYSDKGMDDKAIGSLRTAVDLIKDFDTSYPGRGTDYLFSLSAIRKLIELLEKDGQNNKDELSELKNLEWEFSKKIWKKSNFIE